MSSLKESIKRSLAIQDRLSESSVVEYEDSDTNVSASDAHKKLLASGYKRLGGDKPRLVCV